MQRVFDLLFSATALILLSPLLIITVIFLRCSGEGEVFYVQPRVGYRGKQFNLLKFATMLKDSPNLGTGTITIKDDPRILPFGKFLRTSKINELPQLFNVILGHMSIIGPRPLTQETFSSYPQNVKAVITLVRPGLSGIGSIVFRNEETFITDQSKASEIYEQEIAPFKGDLEIWYVNQRHLSTYFALIFLTVYVVFTSNTGLVWKVFRGLPKPTKFLKNKI